MDIEDIQVDAIIVAGGIGKRMEADRPKQLLELNGRSILRWTLAPFLACDAIARICIVSAKESMGLVRDEVATANPAKAVTIVEGGRERQDSVRNGIASLPEESHIVCVHDAVRPFITAELLTKSIQAAAEHGAVTVVRPLKETVKEVRDGVVAGTPDRSSLWITQTPQVFKTALLREAHEKAHNEGFCGTDDCMLVERLGLPVHIIEGSDYNIKITTPADLRFAGAIAPLFENGGKAC